MQALILEDDPGFQAQLAQALMGKGFNVLCVETLAAAEAFLRLDMADVLVFGERIGGRLSHTAALLAECRNPLVAAVLLTDRSGPELDELFDLMPSLVGILGRRVAPEVVTQVVMAAVAEMASDTVRGRLAARWSAAEEAEGVATVPPAARVASVALAETGAWTGGGAPILSRNAGLSPAPAPVAAEEKPTAGDDYARAWLATVQAAPPVTIDDTEEAEEEPAVEAEVSAAPPAPARPARPSANSTLARVMAAGSRALTGAPASEGREAATARPRLPALPAWFAPRSAESGAPAAPALPGRPPLPRVNPPDRRLNLA